MDRSKHRFRATVRDILLGVVAIGGGLLGSSAFAGINELTSIGPEGGRIFEVEFHRNSPNVIYAATPAGFYRSSDGGQSWQLTQSLSIADGTTKADIAVDPRDSNRVYIASGGNDLLVSQNGGVTFTALAVPGGRKLHVLTGSDGVVYVPDETGMFRSDDGGRSWGRAGTFPRSGADINSNFAVDPGDSRVVYASLFNQGLYVSRDAGVSWQPLPAQMPYNQTLSIEVDPTNPQRLWIASYDAVYRSNDGGASWALSHQGWSGRVVIDPADPMTVYASPSGAEPAWRTTDGGASWGPVPQGFEDRGTYVGIAVHPTQAGRLVGYGNGIWLSSDSGAHWTPARTGLIASTVQRIAPVPNGSGFYLATVNGVYVVDGTGTSRALNNDQLAQLNQPSRSREVVDVVASSNGAVETLLVVLDWDRRMARSVDGGSQWTLLPLPPGAQWVRWPVVSPGAQPILYVATDIGVFSSTDFGDTWTSRSVGLPAIVSQLVLTNDPQVLYAQAQPNISEPRRLYRSSDGAQSWSITALPASTTSFGIHSMAVHPSDARTVVLGMQEGLYRTTDGGATWSQTRANTDNSYYYSIAFDARDPSLVYAGGPRVLRSKDGGAAWERLVETENYYSRAILVAADPSQEDAVLIGTMSLGLQQLSIRPDLQISVQAPATAVIGRVEFGLEVTNRSPLPARDARVSVQLPAGASNISATIANGSCSVNATTVVCTVASLPGQTTVALTVTSTASSEGAYALQASVTATEDDLNTANNSASGQVNVTSAPSTGGGGGGSGGGGGGAMSPLFLLALVALLCLKGARGRTLFALVATFGLSATTLAAEAPTIERTGDWRTNVRKFAEINLKHPAWGASHSTRDYELAKQLAAADNVTLDDDVLYAAAYLHDVAAFAPFAKAGVDHQDEAARVVESLLEGTGFPMAKIEAVRGAIRTHMFGRDPVGPEAIYLHDADALDWLGAIGVARIFGLVDPNGGSPDGPTVVKRLESNLANVPSRVVSKAGKAQTPERVRELEEFLRNLRKQTSDFKTL